MSYKHPNQPFCVNNFSVNFLSQLSTTYVQCKTTKKPSITFFLRSSLIICLNPSSTIEVVMQEQSRITTKTYPTQERIVQLDKLSTERLRSTAGFLSLSSIYQQQWLVCLGISSENLLYTNCFLLLTCIVVQISQKE